MRIERILILVLFLMTFEFVWGTRSTTYLKDQDWKLTRVVKKLGDNYLTEDSMQTKSISSVEVLDSSISLVTMVAAPDDEFSLATLYLYAASPYFSIYVNGYLLENELDGENFHAEITPFIKSGKLLLQLIPKETVPVELFTAIINDAQIAFVQGVFLCHFDTKIDLFFGGKMLEVEVQNQSVKDVDGKIYVRLYRPDTMELVSENNNCAFARQGMTALIDVNFPDSETILKGNHYLAEVLIVDKEDHEAIIDQLELPLQF